MIKILFVIPADLNYNGGIEKTIKKYINVKNNFEKGVLECDKFSIYSKLILNTHNKMNFIVRLFSPLILKIDRIKNIKKIKYIEKNYDIIYLTNDDYYYLFKNTKLIIWSEHGNLPNNYTGINILNKLLLFLFNNKIIFKKIKYFHIINCYNYIYLPINSKYFCVPSGISSEKFTPIAKKMDKIKFLFVGRLEKSKNVDKIVNVFKKLDDNYEINIVGDGELSYLFNDKYNNIHYYKNLPENDLIKIYKNSDVFLFPSILENFGLVVLEALSSGLYVIISNSMKPRFDYFEKMNFLEYIEISEDNLMNSIKNVNQKIEYTSILENKKTIHEYIKNNYDWNILLNNLYNNFEKIYNENNLNI